MSTTRLATKTPPPRLGEGSLLAIRLPVSGACRHRRRMAAATAAAMRSGRGDTRRRGALRSRGVLRRGALGAGRAGPGPRDGQPRPHGPCAEARLDARPYEPARRRGAQPPAVRCVLGRGRAMLEPPLRGFEQHGPAHARRGSPSPCYGMAALPLTVRADELPPVCSLFGLLRSGVRVGNACRADWHARSCWHWRRRRHGWRPTG